MHRRVSLHIGCILQYALGAAGMHYAPATGLRKRERGIGQCITTTGVASTGCAYVILTDGGTTYGDTTTTGLGLGGGGGGGTATATGATTTVRAGT